MSIRDMTLDSLLARRALARLEARNNEVAEIDAEIAYRVRVAARFDHVWEKISPTDGHAAMRFYLGPVAPQAEAMLNERDDERDDDESDVCPRCGQDWGAS